MTFTNRATSTPQWNSTQAYALAVVCLLIGIAGGWLVRGSQAPATRVSEVNASQSASMETNPAAPPPTPEQMKRMADTQAAPVIQKLKTDPDNAQLLADVGNIYYDTQQYPTAIEYYERVLKVQPANTSVRTDMATAYWYLGNTDTAIEEFRKSLSYEPSKANTLFNLGIVEWQGKMDVTAAVTTWQKLLDTNPNYEGRAKVEDLMAQAKKHSNIEPKQSSR